MVWAGRADTFTQQRDSPKDGTMNVSPLDLRQQRRQMGQREGIGEAHPDGAAQRLRRIRLGSGGTRI